MRTPSRGLFLPLRPLHLAIIFISAGILARLAEFFQCHSFWEDEVSLALNIAQRSYGALLTPLSFDQIAPIGFLWLERLMVQLFGVSEYSLRLIPLLAGILAVPLVWIAARQLLGVWPAVFAVALVSLSPGGVRYASEAKQYGVEMFVTAALLFTATYWPERITPARAVQLIGLGVVAMLLANPAIYVLAGFALLLASRASSRKAPLPEWFLLGGVALLWVTFFGTMYLRFFAPILGPGTYMDHFWAPSRLLAQPGLAAATDLIFRSLLFPIVGLEERAPLLQYLAAAMLFAGGVLFCAFGRRGLRREIALLALFPLCLAFVAAIPGKWVFAHRLMMFAVPLTVLLISSAVCWMDPWIEKSGIAQALFIAGCCLFLLFPVKADIYSIRHENQSLRAAVQFSLKQYRPGTTIYVYSRAVPGWTFYSTDWSHPDAQRLAWMTEASRITGPNGGNIQPRQHAVQNEGLDLGRPYRDGRELVGVGEGIFRSRAGAQQHGPDPGWVENEYARVCRESRSHRVIVLGLIPGTRGIPDLISYFRQMGAQTVAEYRGESARADVLETSCPTRELSASVSNRGAPAPVRHLLNSFGL